jgi:hypothetical protein
MSSGHVFKNLTKSLLEVYSLGQPTKDNLLPFLTNNLARSIFYLLNNAVPCLAALIIPC